MWQPKSRVRVRFPVMSSFAYFFSAENILASNDSSSDISLVLPKLHDPLPHGRALAYLVVRVLLLSTSCGQQVDIALQVLAAMKLHSVDGFGDLADGSANLQEA